MKLKRYLCTENINTTKKICTDHIQQESFVSLMQARQ